MTRYYIIHCKEHTEREPYINTLPKLLRHKIRLFEGSYTKNVKLTNQENHIQQFNLKFNNDFRFKFPGEIGCYLSHFNLIKHIMNNDHHRYTVIFEDDVTFEQGLHEKINDVINQTKDIDYDIIFLGNINNNKGEHIKENIYHMDSSNSCWGTHALLINNKNISKIYNSLCSIKAEVDIHYRLECANKELNILTVYPILCDQRRNFKSTIKDIYFSEIEKSIKNKPVQKKI